MTDSTGSIVRRAWHYLRIHGPRRFAGAVLRRLRRAAGFSAPAARPGATLAGFVSRTGVAPATRPAAEVFRRPFVAIIGDLGLPQCKKYRVLQKLEALEHLGVRCDYSHYLDITRSLRLIQMATFVIFYRTRMNESFEFHLSECRRLAVPTAYDIDDPIFSAEIYGANPNLAFLAAGERQGLLASAQSHLAAMRACGAAIVSTPRMADEVRNAGMADVHLWRNAVDRETLHAVARAERFAAGRRSAPGEADAPVTIVYASGSRAHEADFRVAGKEILAALERWPNVRLKVIGYLELPETFAALGNRIEIEPFSHYDAYIASLAAADISVVPLVADDFNDCKSAIRYMEAALVDVPCIATRIGDFRNLVTDGTDGYLAAGDEDWRDALDRLVGDAGLRAAMGAAAHAMVRSRLSAARVADELPGQLRDLIHGR